MGARQGGYINVGLLLLEDVGLGHVHEAQGLMLGIFLVVDAAFVAGFPGAGGQLKVFCGNLEGDDFMQALGVFGDGAVVLVDDRELVAGNLGVGGQDVLLDVGELDLDGLKLAIPEDDHFALLGVDLHASAGNGLGADFSRICGHGVGHHTTGVGRILHIVIDVQDHGKGLFAGVVGHTATLFNLSELACSQAEAEDEQSQYLVIRSHDVLLVLRSASLFREFLLGTLDHLGGDVDGDTGHKAEHHHSGHAVDEASIGGEVGLYQLEDNGAQAAEDGQAEGCADAVALDVLCGNCANLGANGSTDEHDKSGNQFGTTLQGVGGSAVQAGDGNFKEVGADCDVGRAANEVHQGGHTDEAAADAEDTGENASEEGHADGEPCGAVDAGLMEVDHRGDLDGVELGSPVKTGGLFVKDFALGSGFAFLLLAQGHVMEDHPGHEDEQDNVEPADNLIDAAEAFELHDYLGADFHAHHGTDKHCQTELVVNVAEAAVTHGGNKGFTSHVSHVGTNGEGHRETKDVQAGGNHPGAAHAEEAADDADTKTQDDEAGPENGAAGNGHQNIQPVHNVPPYSAAFLCLRSMPM